MRGDARPRHPPPRGAPPCAVPGGRRGAPPEGASSAGTLRGGVRGSGVYGVEQGKGGARRWGGTQPGRGMRSISRPGLMDALRSKGLRDAPGGGMCQQGVRGVGVRWRVRPQEHRERDPSFCLAGGGGLGQLCRCRDPGG